MTRKQEKLIRICMLFTVVLLFLPTQTLAEPLVNMPAVGGTKHFDLNGPDMMPPQPGLPADPDPHPGWPISKWGTGEKCGWEDNLNDPTCPWYWETEINNPNNESKNIIVQWQCFDDSITYSIHLPINSSIYRRQVIDDTGRETGLYSFSYDHNTLFNVKVDCTVVEGYAGQGSAMQGINGATWELSQGTPNAVLYIPEPITLSFLSLGACLFILQKRK